MQLKDLNGDWVTLRSPFTVVEIVEIAAETLVEGRRAAERQTAITADAEAGGVDCTGLWWGVELELIVGCNVTSATLVVLEHAIVDGQLKGGICPTGNHDSGLGTAAAPSTCRCLRLIIRDS